MTYWPLFYHVVWATNGCQPWIEPYHHEQLSEEIRAKGNDHRAIVHAVGIMPDHIHVVVSIPPSIAVSKLVGSMKGASSRLLNTQIQPERTAAFAWQAEYGVHSFAEKNLSDVMGYANNQLARHSANRLWPKLERIDTRDLPEARN